MKHTYPPVATAILAVIGLIATAAPAAAQANARYGTREARTCVGMNGPPTNANVA